MGKVAIKVLETYSVINEQESKVLVTNLVMMLVRFGI